MEFENEAILMENKSDQTNGHKITRGYKKGRMLPRERVIRALRRNGPDRVPACARFTPPMMRIFNEHVGAEIPERHMGPDGVPSGFIHEVRPSFLTPDEYFEWDVRHVSFSSPSPSKDLAAYHKNLPPGAPINEWGVAFVRSSSFHYTKRLPPLGGMKEVEELKDFPFPDPMQLCCHENLDEQVAAIQEDGFAAAGFLQQTLFELAWEMRGMDTLLMDFLMNVPFAEYLLERLTEIRCAMAARYADAGVDVLRLGDDLGTQRSLIMAPETFRSLLKPRLKRIIDAARARKPDILIFFHSDGSVMPLVEDMIEMGIDVLNPIQPECVDIAEIKSRFGDRLSFWGGVGIQTTMPFGTPQEVKDTVKRVIEVLGEGGGLFIAPSHALQPDVPWENVVAFFDAVDEYGWY
jgi:uroporphyrinogen decarboxylase